MHLDDPVRLAYARHVNHHRWFVTRRREVGFEPLQAPSDVSGAHDLRSLRCCLGSALQFGDARLNIL